MSDLVKSQESKPARRGGRKTAASDRSKVELKNTDKQADVVAGSTMVEAAIDLADAELGAASRAYVDRTGENLNRFSDFARMVQAQAARAVKAKAYEEFGVTEEELYGPEADG